MTWIQKQKVVEIEKTAWKNAEGLARILKIPLGKWYYKDKKLSLATYKSLGVRPHE